MTPTIVASADVRPLPPPSPLATGRRRLPPLVVDRVDADDPLYAGSDEARPTDRMPILRLDEDGRLIPELRRWGFIMMVNGKTVDKVTGEPKKVRRA